MMEDETIVQDLECLHQSPVVESEAPSDIQLERKKGRPRSTPLSTSSDKSQTIVQDMESLQSSEVKSKLPSDIQLERKRGRPRSNPLSTTPSQKSQKSDVDVECNGFPCTNKSGLCTIVSVVTLITILTVIALVLYLGS